MRGSPVRVRVVAQQISIRQLADAYLFLIPYSMQPTHLLYLMTLHIVGLVATENEALTVTEDLGALYLIALYILNTCF